MADPVRTTIIRELVTRLKANAPPTYNFRWTRVAWVRSFDDAYFDAAAAGDGVLALVRVEDDIPEEITSGDVMRVLDVYVAVCRVWSPVTENPWEADPADEPVPEIQSKLAQDLERKVYSDVGLSVGGVAQAYNAEPSGVDFTFDPADDFVAILYHLRIRYTHRFTDP